MKIDGESEILQEEKVKKTVMKIAPKKQKNKKYTKTNKNNKDKSITK